MEKYIAQELCQTSNLLNAIAHDEAIISKIKQISLVCTNSLRQGNKILFIGNGGSAADAQHLAAELVCRLQFDRPGLAALALTTDSSILTAIGNDYGYESLFSRQLEAIANKNDVLIAISTSGRSPNILHALETARKKQVITVGLTGANPSPLAQQCDHVLQVPSTETQKIQECHIVFGHILCALIENQLFAPDRIAQTVREEATA